MIKLADIFQNRMILQRGKPFKIFGESDRKATLRVSLNGKPLGVFNVGAGEFVLTLPPQQKTENATLKVGNITLENVDFGEVWIAAGQSNMMFLTRWDAEREQVYSLPEDNHLRYFEVPKIAFDGEEKDGYTDLSRQNKWFDFNKENSPYFSAVATYFALKLKTALDVPVGIVGCSYGGTSASAWVDEDTLLKSKNLQSYAKEYEDGLEKLDMDKYLKANLFKRSGASLANDDYMYRNTVTAEEQFINMMKTLPPDAMQKLNDIFSDKNAEAAFAAVGPHDANRPAALYHTMLKKIIGFTASGVIFYQGCSDDYKAEMYEELFTALIEKWRKDWGDKLPFIFAQLAPFGKWMGATGERFPEIRDKQKAVADKVESAYIVSTSDVGNEYDIHPKFKRKVGERMALKALNKVYFMDIGADAPECVAAKLTDGKLALTFKNADGLFVDGDKIEAMVITADGKKIENYLHKVCKNEIIISFDGAEGAKDIEISFATAPYYQVNLYNKAGISALPFEMKCII